MLCFLPFAQIRHVLCLQEALFSSMLVVWLKATMKRLSRRDAKVVAIPVRERTSDGIRILGCQATMRTTKKTFQSFSDFRIFRSHWLPPNQQKRHHRSVVLKTLPSLWERLMA
jgi:hypothetical protein